MLLSPIFPPDVCLIFLRRLGESIDLRGEIHASPLWVLRSVFSTFFRTKDHRLRTRVPRFPLVLTRSFFFTYCGGLFSFPLSLTWDPRFSL